ncbi:MAG: hypothetical protein ACTSPB_26535, partial [Candidatus Thorarchaeota archaeon]
KLNYEGEVNLEDITRNVDVELQGAVTREVPSVTINISFPDMIIREEEDINKIVTIIYKKFQQHTQEVGLT